MADWKDALSALAGMSSQDDAAEEKTPVERKSRVGVVYSTDPDYQYDDDAASEIDTLPVSQQRLRLSMERAGRGGKTVTLVRGFVGRDADLQVLAKLLKQRCGVGGSVKDGEIIIQGDHRARLVEILRKEGYTQAK